MNTQSGQRAKQTEKKGNKNWRLNQFSSPNSSVKLFAARCCIMRKYKRERERPRWWWKGNLNTWNINNREREYKDWKVYTTIINNQKLLAELLFSRWTARWLNLIKNKYSTVFFSSSTKRLFQCYFFHWFFWLFLYWGFIASKSK